MNQKFILSRRNIATSKCCTASSRDLHKFYICKDITKQFKQNLEKEIFLILKMLLKLSRRVLAFSRQNERSSIDGATQQKCIVKEIK